MTRSGNILDLPALAVRAAAARAAGKRVVHCHGVFDLLHVGHIRHFRWARRLGDLLLVTVTPDRYVNKGPHRPFFNERLRAEAVAALGCVDGVAVNCWPTAVEAIRLLRPRLYVKGQDYRAVRADVTGEIAREKAAVCSVGGRIAFTDDVVFSSSRLLNRCAPFFPPETTDYLAGFLRRRSLQDVLAPLQAARRLEVLVVGEAIIDEYRYCEAIGKSSKEPTLAVKQLGREFFAGGILAVANHVAGFCGRVGLVTLLGAQNPRLGFIRRKLRPNVVPRFLYRRDAPTIVKTRYVESYHFAKMLEVYEFNDALPEEATRRKLRALLARELPRYDAVIVVDYGHGMLDDEVIALLCRRARFLALNVQANAGNIGYHTVGRYPRADLVCVAENEIRLESRDRRGDLRGLVRGLSKKLGFKKIIVTRGKHGCLAYDSRRGFAEIPAVAGRIEDRIGAGDAFLSLAALCVAQDAPMEIAGFVGNVAGARAVATVGNRAPVGKAELLKNIEALIK